MDVASGRREKHESQTRVRSASVAGEVGDVLDDRAEAGRADERAVAAGQAARRRPRPSAGARGCGRAAPRRSVVSSVRPMRSAAPRDGAAGGVEVGRRRAARRGELGEDLARRARCRPRRGSGARRRGSRSAPGRSPRSRLRAGAHRDAEAGAAGLEAVDRDDESVARGGPRSRRRCSGRRGSTRSWIVDPVQLARADADQRERRVVVRLLLDLEAAVLPPRAPEPDAAAERGTASTECGPTA